MGDQLLNSKICSIHERAIRITCQDNTLTFQDVKTALFQYITEVLAKEMFKIRRGLSPEYLSPKQICIIFAEIILLKDASCTLYDTVLNRYRF